jgi:hypothetical protein
MMDKDEFIMPLKETSVTISGTWQDLADADPLMDLFKKPKVDLEFGGSRWFDLKWMIRNCNVKVTTQTEGEYGMEFDSYDYEDMTNHSLIAKIFRYFNRIIWQLFHTRKETTNGE